MAGLLATGLLATTVNQTIALANKEDRASLLAMRGIVEKEILHYDILRTLGQGGFLKGLTFIGGTCLRLCHRSDRLSEDLDFAGGPFFSKDHTEGMADALISSLTRKYGQSVTVRPPTLYQEDGDTLTWKILLETVADRPDLPLQRIHLDISTQSSFDSGARLIRPGFIVPDNIAGMAVQASSIKEIFVDKIIALTMRPKVKQRDIWDLAWMSGRGITADASLLAKKMADRGISQHVLVDKLNARVAFILNDDGGAQSLFLSEMRRFVPASVSAQTLDTDTFWSFVRAAIADLQEGITVMPRGLFSHRIE